MLTIPIVPRQCSVLIRIKPLGNGLDSASIHSYICGSPAAQRQAMLMPLVTRLEKDFMAPVIEKNPEMRTIVFVDAVNFR